MPPRRNQLSRFRGFTLIELLTAMVIASIIMILLMGLMDQSSSTYRTSQNAVSSLSEARAFFHFLEGDLSSRLPGTPFMAEESANADKFAFIRAQSFDEQISPTEGDLRTSIYYVAFTNDQAGTVSPKLFRRLLNDVDTQTILETAGSPAMPNVDPTIDEPIVYNVVSFEAKPKTYDSAGQLQPWTATSNTPPAVLDVTLEITDDFTAARFRTEGSWATLRDPASKPAKQSVRRFKRSIILSQ
jgi:prepilin-type N-terminal cleavage/methylation domain-containing protein